VSAAAPIERLLVAGCGDLGTRVALLATARGATVFGLRRDAARVPAPITAIAGDLARGDWAVPDALDTVVLCVAPGREARAAKSPAERAAVYEATYLAGARGLVAALKRADARPRRIVFTSSTGVYGADDGRVVDEDTPPEPSEATGRVLLATEEFLATSGFPSTALRLGGIFGPGRTRLVEQVLNGEAHYGVSPPRFTNRIHVDDAAAAVVHLLELADAPAVVCGVDDTSATEGEVLVWLARRLGALDPRPLPGRSPHGAGKRVSNARLRASGFRCSYPSFREGYEALIAELGEGPFTRRTRAP
jgi:nucleoside-diphosphate-sugar epimerase